MKNIHRFFNFKFINYHYFDKTNNFKLMLQLCTALNSKPQKIN